MRDFPPAERTGPEFKQAVEFGRELAARLPAADKQRISSTIDRAAVRTIRIEAVRAGMRDEFSAVRTEMRDEFSAVRNEMHHESSSLREEIRLGDEETRRYMRVLHEEVISRIAMTQEGHDASRPRHGKTDTE